MKKQKSKLLTKADTRRKLKMIAHRLSPNDWTRRLKRLEAEIRQFRNTELVPHEKHALVQEFLPRYVTDELHGRDVRELYPAIAEHLNQCARCYRGSVILRAALQDNAFESTLTDRLSPSISVPLWQRLEFPALRGKSPRVQFLLNPNLGFPLSTRAFAVRGAKSAAGELVLNEQVLFDKQPLLVQAWLHRDPQAEQVFDLRVLLNAPRDVLRQLHISLAWGKRKIAGYRERGQTIFHVGRADFSEPVSLSIESLSHEAAHRSQTPRAKKK